MTPFAFWYEGDPDGGCIRFLTETESERLMGLPEGWTKYGADGEEIRPLQRYKALGNAIALPCADYIIGPERRIEPMFEAYITNTALYPMMGIEVGTTVHFPTTTQEVQAALAQIGIDGKRYSEVFITSFETIWTSTRTSTS